MLTAISASVSWLPNPENQRFQKSPNEILSSGDSSTGALYLILSDPGDEYSLQACRLCTAAFDYLYRSLKFRKGDLKRSSVRPRNRRRWPGACTLRIAIQTEGRWRGKCLET